MRQYQDGEYLVTEYDNGVVTRELNMPLPSPVKQWSKREFIKLFTPAEWSAAKTLATTDPIAEQLMDLIMLSEYISADDPDLASGLDYFTAIGILAEGRKAEILA